MNLFEQAPYPQETPEMQPQNFLQFLYAQHDIDWADAQFDDPIWWQNEMMNKALNIVSGAIAYCHRIGDTDSAERISRINWENRWHNSTGDMAADLNFIYHILSGENISAQIYDKNRENFLLSILKKWETKKPSFIFPKRIIPRELWVNEQSSLEELNNALRKAFIAQSKRQPYDPKNLAKLRGSSQ